MNWRKKHPETIVAVHVAQSVEVNDAERRLREATARRIRAERVARDFIDEFRRTLGVHQ